MIGNLNMSSSLNWFQRWFLARLALFLIAISALAQSGSGKVQGQVTDSSGGAIPAISVAAVDAAGLSHVAQTNEEGRYLKRSLQQQLQHPVVVGNISAKGWGPPSELAYLKQNGTFDADILILELSSHDYADVPTADPVVGISPDFPDKKPALALMDLVETYLVPRYLHKANNPPTYLERSVADHSQSEQDVAMCRAAENDIFALARAHRAKVALVQHLTLPELRGSYYVGYYANQIVARQAGVPYTDDSAELRAELESGHSPYFDGDPIHLNKSGQHILAHSLQAAANLALRSNQVF